MASGASTLTRDPRNPLGSRVTMRSHPARSAATAVTESSKPSDRNFKGFPDDAFIHRRYTDPRSSKLSACLALAAPRSLCAGRFARPSASLRGQRRVWAASAKNRGQILRGRGY